MKVNGAYKFRTKANVFPGLKICFLGQYQDRASGDTNFSFFIATPGNEVEEVVIENPYTGDFFIPKIEEVYLQNVGNKKTDWVATFKCTWDTSLNEQEGELKVLLGYKVGETVTEEKPKEYISVETDPKYLVNTIAQRKHGALHAIGNGFFTGNNPVAWHKYEITATSNSKDDEVVGTGSAVLSSSGTSPDVTETYVANTNNTGQTYPFYYYDVNGLVEQGIKPIYSEVANLNRVETGISYFGSGLRGSMTLVNSLSCSDSVHLYSNGVGLENAQGSVKIPPYTNGGSDSFFYGPSVDLYSEDGYTKSKFWLTSSIHFSSTITAAHSINGSFATTQTNNIGSLSGSHFSSANWSIENYSTFLTRNLTTSFLFKNEESVDYSSSQNKLFNSSNQQSEISGNTSVDREYKTTVYLVSLLSGEAESLCEFSTTKNTIDNDQYHRIASYWGRYKAKPMYSWDYYLSSNPLGVNEVSYAHQCIGNKYNELIVVENETPINIFMKAVSHRGKSTLRANFLYYVESDVVNLSPTIVPHVESDAFTPDIDGFLNKEFTLSILVFNINDIENYETKQVKFKPSKIPEGMEGLTISKILAIQYIE